MTRTRIPFARLGGALLLAAMLAAPALAQSRTLDHGWQFAPDPQAQWTATTVDAKAPWRANRAGLSWNAQFSDLRDYAGIGWYRVRIEMPRPLPGTRSLLHFGAVDYLADVWLNGTHLGQHEGGYLPFTFDMTDAGHAGTNEVLVRVFDPPMRAGSAGQNQAGNLSATNPVVTALERRYPYDEVPHGKQNWYVQTGGIWQPVTVETVPGRYVERVHVTPNNSGAVEIEATLAGSGEAGPLAARLLAPDGEQVASLDLKPEGGVARGKARIANPELWDTEHPNLYTLVLDNGMQRVKTRFGFRELTARDGKLFLNGKPFYMRAALDQAFYPVGIYTPPSEQYLREQMLKSKAMGLNMLRCHIKVPTPEYLDAADETGMLVWYEIPVWNDKYHWTPEAAARGVDIFKGEVERDWNHPSIAIQSIMNEQWGMDVKQANQRAWLKRTYEEMKQLTAPLGRIVTDDSACCSGFHIQSDLADWHVYYSIPDHAPQWAKWVDEYAGRPKWLFSHYGDAAETGKEPLIVSEFGNWGLPELPPRKDLPWWFPRDFDGNPITRPAGVFERFHAYGFGRIFPDYQALAVATEKHEYLSLKYEIEQMRKHGSIEGYVITELTDANWETNGLMNMWREPKVFAAELGRLQQDDLVMAGFPAHNFRAGQPIELPLTLSHYSQAGLAGASILWQTTDGQSGMLPLAHAPRPGEVAEEGTLRLHAAEVEAAAPEYLRVELVNAQGETLAQNRYRYAVYPAAKAPGNVTVAVHDPLGRLGPLANALKAAGVAVGGEEAPGAVWITSQLDAATSAHLAAGGRALLIAGGKDAIGAGNSGAGPKLSIVPRAGSDLSGDWVSNFNWALTSDPLWKPLTPVIEDSILGWEAAQVTPEYAIAGLDAKDSGLVLAGVFYGWLNDNRAYLARLKEGKGELMATTFRFGSYGRDPFATELLNRILSSLQ